MPIEWVKREGAMIVLFVLTLAGGAYGAMNGLNGLTVVIGIMAFLIVLVIGLTRPKMTPYIIVFFTVFDRDLHLSGPVQLTSLTIVLFLLAPGFLRVIMTGKAVPRFARVGIWMLIFGLIVASLASAQPDLAWAGLVRWVPALIMIMGVGSLCITEEGMSRRVANALVYGGAVCGAFGILQRSGRYWLVGPPYAPDVTDSTFGYYTNFANFEALAAVVGVSLIISGLRLRRRLPLLITASTLLCVYMVATSYSRGAVGLVAVGLLVILLKELARPFRFFVVVGLLSLMGWLVVQLAPAELLAELIGKFTSSQNGDIVRSQLQAGGLQMLAKSPLGIGFNNFSALISSGDIYSTLALAHSHNTFVQMGLDAGWLGGAGFLILVVGAFWRAFRSKGGVVAVGFGAALAGFLVQVSQDYFFFEEASLVAFGLLVAGSVAGLRQKRTVEGDSLGTSDDSIGDISGKVGLRGDRTSEAGRASKLGPVYRDYAGQLRSRSSNKENAKSVPLTSDLRPGRR
ncbi:O-antigen ligase family protein [Arthrobacter sp. FW306-2-2C-D06B]|uniref:O-antigen ligase family protein n=1 Tax=Arthrobacter sp. FW306-2-2C-D06B TaxID=2879618 RepID=UPI001F47CBEA|nr:O-antigen ligase family protein [Arthrobacter sp. FW306-2-2C-D06B]UKA60770.1 O-antigen ligase family protein [Arthrobacter sp. FW306-2-2C-D06B]